MKKHEKMQAWEFYGKFIVDGFVTVSNYHYVTEAPTPRKAESNIVYRFKKDLGIAKYHTVHMSFQSRLVKVGNETKDSNSVKLQEKPVVESSEQLAFPIDDLIKK